MVLHPQEILDVREYKLSPQVAGEVEPWVRKSITKLFSQGYLAAGKVSIKLQWSPLEPSDQADSYNEC